MNATNVSLAFNERREKLRSIDHAVSFRKSVSTRVRFEQVDARVDRVTGNLVGFRLLEESDDVTVRVGLDQPNADGFSTGVSTIVAFAFRSRWSRRTAARSTRVSTSPLNTTTVFIDRRIGVLHRPAVAQRNRFDHDAAV